ncbi:11738_t:CDS:1 [Diversispora eburnea]|uniref:11738_t:CDS:1 n=1 Tax=Diversispora eburnea TaxID=1213867 RepID=A0A9N8VM99_9GLOM|nr:11738_t:CDS:1 [Diversispora eburnea]
MTMFSVISKCFNPRSLNPRRFLTFNKNRDGISKPKPVMTTLVPPDFENEGNDNTNTTLKIVELLSEAEEYLNTHEYTRAITVLQHATQCGSATAAAKLGIIYHGGINDTIPPDYASAAVYYLFALKLIYMIPCNKWDMSLVLDVIAGLSELYRFQMNRKRDCDIWNHGIKAMKHIDQALQDPLATKFLSHKEIQKRRAIRIHIAYCLGLTAEADKDFSTALTAFQNCQKFGDCGFNTADKLVKKSHTKVRTLEPQVPRVKPVCVECQYEAKELKDIWTLLVCAKCQSVACCSKACLTNHLSTHHENEGEDKKTK